MFPEELVNKIEPVVYAVVPEAVKTFCQFVFPVPAVLMYNEPFVTSVMIDPVADDKLLFGSPVPKNRLAVPNVFANVRILVDVAAPVETFRFVTARFVVVAFVNVAFVAKRFVNIPVVAFSKVAKKFVEVEFVIVALVTFRFVIFEVR